MGVGAIASSYAPAGGWAPTDITGLKLWLDASDAATFTYSAGTVVSQWNDKSGIGNHMVQATDANRPNRNGTQNGLATVAFDGSNDHMTGPLLTSSANNFTMFVAFDGAGGTGRRVLFGNGTSSNGYFLATRAALSGSRVGWLAGGSAWVPSTDTDEPTNPATMCLQRAAGTATVYVNGAATAPTSAVGTITPTTRSVVGASQAGSTLFNGEIFEVLFYDASLTGGERGVVETYLTAKWGI